MNREIDQLLSEINTLNTQLNKLQSNHYNIITHSKSIENMNSLIVTIEEKRQKITQIMRSFAGVKYIANYITHKNIPRIVLYSKYPENLINPITPFFEQFVNWFIKSVCIPTGAKTVFNYTNDHYIRIRELLSLAGIHKFTIEVDTYTNSTGPIYTVTISNIT